MKISSKIALLAIVGLTLAIVVTGTGNTEQGTTYSGFLENYPAFEADKDRPGALIYRKLGADLKAYSKVFIDPIEIWYAPDCKYKGIKPDELKILADAFRAALVSELEPDYPVVSKTGPDVLGIRMAITNVHVTKKKRGLLGYTPAGLVLSTAVKAIGDNMSLQDATIETELLDSQSNERLAALIDRKHDEGSGAGKALGKLRTVQKGGVSWEEIENTLKFYAKRLRGRLDAEHEAQ